MTSQPITPDFEEAVALYVEWAERAATHSTGIATIPNPTVVYQNCLMASGIS